MNVNWANFNIHDDSVFEICSSNVSNESYVTPKSLVECAGSNLNLCFEFSTLPRGSFPPNTRLLAKIDAPNNSVEYLSHVLFQRLEIETYAQCPPKLSSVTDIWLRGGIPLLSGKELCALMKPCMLDKIPHKL